MTARIIDGKAVAERLRGQLAERIATLPFRPGLRVVRVGDDPASGVYVRNKDRAAAAAGFDSATIHLPADTRESDLLMLVEDLNIDPAVDGILVQLPLPPQIRPEMVIAAIDPAKDVDGFHPMNAGRLATQQHGLVPCTPKGVMHLLREAGAKLPGARAVVLGRSQIVGRPMAQLLLRGRLHRDHRAFPHPRPGRRMPPGGDPGGRRRPGRDGPRRLDRRGRRGDRCRHQPQRRRQAGRRRRLRRGGASAPPPSPRCPAGSGR